jgi:ADP-heptose:LPS heptosyltransferase
MPSTAHPAGKIDWVVAKGFEALLDHHPMINRSGHPKDRWKNLRALSQTAAEIRSLFQALRMERFDLVLICRASAGAD